MRYLLLLVPTLLLSCKTKPEPRHPNGEDPGRIVARELFLLDEEGDVGIAMSASQEKNSIRIGTGKNGSEIYINAFGDGRKAILLRSDFGKNRIGLSTDVEGNPTILLYGNGRFVFRDESSYKVLTIEEADSQINITGAKPKEGKFFEYRLQPSSENNETSENTDRQSQH